MFYCIIVLYILCLQGIGIDLFQVRVAFQVGTYYSRF